ncbi:PIG-L family deacetylase [Actinoallomurus spadix]|uniref:GlcNAc-PI de-N-acetylase n=1 Tax=Actinoallomurus spadix TaxID=79912 RepID=A0ABN0W6L0_9ACTN|nr:PIG-L family deacetylase [Actinoallomurus spadix]MCO5986266.1 PIG-L family deacetylase [Actinoallomurus spadix]
MAGRPARTIAGLAAAATCAGLLGLTGPARAAGQQALPVQAGFVQVVAHPDDDLLFMSPDLANDIRRGEAVTTVVLSAGEGHAGMGDAHDPLAYVAQRRQGLHSAYAAMAGVTDGWRVETVRSGRVNIEVHTLTARPNIHLAFLSLPDGRDPRVHVGRRAIAQLRADRRSAKCSPTVTPPLSPYAHCYTHADVVRALVTLFTLYRPTVVRTQDPSPDRRYTTDHTDHRATAQFATEAVAAYGRPVAQVDYRDYNLGDTPVNLRRTESAAKQRVFADYRANDYRINPEARNFASWQLRMRYRWPRGASWTTRAAGGRLQAFAVLSGRLYTWWQTPTGWSGPASLGGSGLAPSLTTAGGQVFARRGGDLVAARPRYAGGRWTATWTDLGPATGTPLAVPGRTGRPAVFVRDAKGGVSVKCQATDGSWTPWRQLRVPAPKTAHRRAAKPSSPRPRPTAPSRTPSVSPTPSTTPTPSATPSARPPALPPLPLPLPRKSGTPTPSTTPATPRTTPRGTASPRPTTTPSPGKKATRAPARKRPRVIPPARDVQDGMDAVGGSAGIELFAPTRTQVLQWRQGQGCSFAYAGAVPGVRPNGPVTATRDAGGNPTLVYEEADSTAIRQAKETGRAWSGPATPLRAVFHETGEAPVPTGSRVPPPALPLPAIGVPMVATDGTGRVYALALAEDGRLYVSSRGPAGIYGPWSPAA